MIRLNARERLWAIVLAVCVSAWVGHRFVLAPAMQRLHTLERVVPDKQRQLVQLQRKVQQYLQLRQKLAAVQAEAASQPEIELASLLESLTKDCGLAAKLATMKQFALPSDSSCKHSIVEMKFERLTLGELARLLQAIETEISTGSVRGLHVRKSNRDNSLLDVTVEVQRFSFAGQSTGST